MCLTLSVSAQTANDVAVKYNEAAALVREKKFTEAIPVLQEAATMGIAVGPEALQTVQQAQKLLPVCTFQKAVSQAKTGNLDGALATLKTASELGELYGDLSTMNKCKAMTSKIYTMKAAKAFNAKDYATAAEIFAQGYEANKLDTSIGLNLAMSYCELGAAGNAEAKAKGFEVYQAIMALEKRHSRYKEPAATAKEKMVYYLMLDAGEAAKANNANGVYTATDKVLALDATNATAKMLRLQTATNKKDWNKVIAEGESAAAAQTTPELKSEAYFLLGAAYQNKEDKAKAIAIYQKVTAGAKVETAKSQIALLSK